MSRPNQAVEALKEWGRWQRSMPAVGPALARSQWGAVGRGGRCSSQPMPDSEVGEWLDRQLCGLGEANRPIIRALKLRYISEMSAVEAAARVGCSEAMYRRRCEAGEWYVGGLLVARAGAA